MTRYPYERASCLRIGITRSRSTLCCTERVELIMNQLAQREGVTEVLKASDQMEWIKGMNSIQARAEEVVLSELVYR